MQRHTRHPAWPAELGVGKIRAFLCAPESLIYFYQRDAEGTCLANQRIVLQSHARENPGPREFGKAFANLQSRLYNQGVMSPAPDRPPNSFLRMLPKAELHLHLEGAIEPATLLELRQRHGEGATQAEVDALYRYEDFQGFLLAFK